jgi:putative transposase
MDHYLGYEKNDAANKETENRRNGHSRKTVRSDYGNVELSSPLDREGEFEPFIVKKHQKNVTGIEDQIIALYAKGVSTRERFRTTCSTCTESMSRLP